MVDPFAQDPVTTTGNGTERARADLNARFQHLRHDAEDLVSETPDTISRRAGEAADAVSGDAGRTGRQPGFSSKSSFKAQASQAASDAKGAAASIADQARSRFAEIIDQQKAAGASRVAGVAQAAQSAAKDLDDTNPELARLVRSAADGVDRIAADIRSRDLGDVIDTVASFGRRQPVAFFGGAVLAGFLLSRFFKSDAPVMNDDPAGSL